jgi:TonB family protein
MNRARSASRRVFVSLAAALVLAPIGWANAPIVKAAQPTVPPATTEQEITQRLEGKFLILRGFYMEDKLEFDVEGKVVGAPPRGSFTLSGLQVKKVHATKHSIEIEADRIGLHFFGGLPYEDDTKPFEQIKVSKKPVVITMDRLVIEPEKKKKKNKNEPQLAAANAPKPATTATPAVENAASGVTNPPDVTYNEPAAPKAATPSATAAAKPAPEPIHPDPKQSWIQLSKAIDTVFAPGLDESVISTLPDCWQTYFATKEGKRQAARIDSSVMHPGTGVVSPKLLSSLDPTSNDYAQKANIAGMTLLSTVVNSNGEPSHVTIVRPIGFGLDEQAVAAVSHAKFRPGLRNGQPVPVEVNLQVTFRIYSDLTRPEPGKPQPPAPVTPASVPTTSHSNGKEVAVNTPQ